VRLNASIPAEASVWHIGDYDGDGAGDLMLKFERSALVSTLPVGENVAVTVTGDVAAEQFSGTDYIRVINPPIAQHEGRGSALIPETVSLEVLPNRFNPSVQITYSVPRTGRVLIQVWDVEGRLVRTIEDREKPEGVYSTEWYGRDEAGGRVSSGVYFCRLSVGDEVAIRKLTFLR